ncbi:MAG TPA: DUF192 domain-containing protein [Solirubrobacterales bacterium]|nr:DUF192 domain-containing protein [Solirubrobacterales bacterium]
MGHHPRIIPVAKGFRTRLLGLSWRSRERAGPGLLIPRCSSVHTFGMRFPLDVYFLDAEGRVIAVRRRLPPGRVAWQRGAAAILEIPSPSRGERPPALGLGSPCCPKEKR